MNRRRLLVIPVLATMVAFGFGVYFLWGATAHKAGEFGGKREKPQTSQFTVPGTVIVTQDGNLYKLQGTTFTEIANGNAPQGSGEGWQQPTVTPNHQDIIAVKREYNYSDLYELNLQGQVVAQLTNDNVSSNDVSVDQWAFYPEVTQNGSTVFYTYDQKEEPDNYQIDFSVYSMPLASDGQASATAWTNPYGDGCPGDSTQGPAGPDPDCGSGGSLSAVPLASGGVILAYGYVNTNTQQTLDQIAYLPGPLQNITTLTSQNESCYSPAVSPDGTRIAFVCSPADGGGSTSLEVATLSGGTVGTPQVVASGSLIGSPTWSPDGQSLLYFDASAEHQYFQMMVLPVPTAAAPAASTTKQGATAKEKAKATPTPTPTPAPTPQALTTDNDFLATSAAVWFSS